MDDWTTWKLTPSFNKYVSPTSHGYPTAVAPKQKKKRPKISIWDAQLLPKVVDLRVETWKKINSIFNQRAFSWWRWLLYKLYIYYIYIQYISFWRCLFIKYHFISWHIFLQSCSSKGIVIVCFFMLEGLTNLRYVFGKHWGLFISSKMAIDGEFRYPNSFIHG